MPPDLGPLIRHSRKALRWKRALRRLSDVLGFPYQPTWANFHGYRIGPPVTEVAVEDFETDFGIQFPADYRALLLQHGCGFAGPYFGISGYSAWNQPSLSDLDDDHAWNPQVPFNPETFSNLSADGALRICNAGCEHYYLLIVSGSHAGEVWRDSTTDGLGVAPLEGSHGKPIRFGEWYEQWLVSDQRVALDSFWHSRDFPGHVYPQVLDELGHAPRSTVAADQLPCPSCSVLLRTRNCRVVVPSLDSKKFLANPKEAALAAAAHGAQVTPKEVLP